MNDIMQNEINFLNNLKEVLTKTEYTALSAYLGDSTFFSDPASARYHSSYQGGLCAHSLAVLQAARIIAGAFGYDDDKSVTKVALLHDVCKIGCYKETFRNVKKYDEESIKKYPVYKVKHDGLGDFVWESEKSYTYEENFAYGHGEKSVYILRKYIYLTDEEAQAIRFHMGAFMDGEKRNVSACFSENKLALILHFADMYATNYLEH